ncbi:DNA cytosine methyltransferase [Nocardia farcinica]|uniref:DNA cytosine methyltransferase n=1 Tax=Nocardia farcinica TaxID=37329 RepID=UPI002B4BD1A8|nr:DNA cytosine methyltransferase [Nocardia farcinica]
MLELMDWFCGAGGSTQGASKVPGVCVTRAANHWDKAIETHATNYPEADHFLGDLSTEEAKAQIVKWPVADIFWASPECPQWSSARGKKRDFHNTLQGDLLDLQRDEEADRSRALMEEVPMYLRGVIERGGRVRAGVVENVVEVRQWDQWHRWIGEIRALGLRGQGHRPELRSCAAGPHPGGTAEPGPALRRVLGSQARPHARLEQVVASDGLLRRMRVGTGAPGIQTPWCRHGPLPHPVLLPLPSLHLPQHRD